VLSELSQGSTLGSILLSIFINDLCPKICFSEFSLFADNLEMFQVIKSAEDGKLPQSDIDYVQKWCFKN
jgi:hypothetical protein